MGTAFDMNIRRTLLLTAARLPYGPVAKGLARLYRSSWIQSTLFRKRRRRFLQVADEIGAAGDRRIAFSRHLGCNLLMPWRVTTLSRAKPEVFDRWVRISGLEYLQQARGSGRGVILVNSHIGAGRMVPLVLLRLGYELASIEPHHYLKMMGARGAERVRVLRLDKISGFWLKELFLAKQLLESGGLLHWAVDGLAGSSGGDERNFHGRRRNFLRSFAELGIKTGSLLLPVFATIDEAGVIQVTLQPPLEPEVAEPADQAAAIESAMTQYLSMLERQWLADPGNIVERHLFRFPKWPKV